MQAALAAADELGKALPFPPVVFGVGAFLGLVALLAVTFAFRHAGSRH